MNNELVDKILILVSNRTSTPIYDFLSRDFGIITHKEKSDIVKYMIDKNLIKQLRYESSVECTSHGLEIVNNGGWLKYIELKNIESNKLKEKEKKELKKLDLDIELNEKVVKDYPKTKRLSIVGILIGAFAIILQIIQLIIEWQSKD